MEVVKIIQSGKDICLPAQEEAAFKVNNAVLVTAVWVGRRGLKWDCLF